MFNSKNSFICTYGSKFIETNYQNKALDLEEKAAIDSETVDKKNRN